MAAVLSDGILVHFGFGLRVWTFHGSTRGELRLRVANPSGLILGFSVGLEGAPGDS